MKRASKRNLPKVTGRPLKMETLERCEVFDVGGLDPSFASGFGNNVDGFGGTSDFAVLGGDTSERVGSNANIANHRHQLSLH